MSGTLFFCSYSEFMEFGEIVAGFLNANPAPHIRARVANYGLMDQMAALHWIQQNIEKFGGNPTMITLVGHGTGAACIDFLMASPTMGEHLTVRHSMIRFCDL